MNHPTYTIRKALPAEYGEIGSLMVEVYSSLDGFPSAHEQPDYYRMLGDIGAIAGKPGAELLVAVSSASHVAGAVVYFSDMLQYGSGGTASLEKNASGFRLLAVNPEFQGQGIGKLLTHECIRKARHSGAKELIIHTTASMQTAWKMYEGLGFRRSPDLDFMQDKLPVFGFRLPL